MRITHLEQFLTQVIPTREPICIQGRPGIGKTDIVKRVAAFLNYDLIITHPVVDQPIDYKGLPGFLDGKAEFLPYGVLRKMLEADRPTIVFFDDLGQATEAVQKALMQLLLAREINGQKISEYVTFVAATNRKEDKAGVTGMLEPVKSRFICIVELEFHLDDWTVWAGEVRLNPTVIAFANYRANLLYEYKPTKDMTNSPNPRTMHKLATLADLKMPDYLRREAYVGCIGSAGGEYVVFEDMANQLQDPRDILANPQGAELPSRNKPDVCFATASGLAHHVNEKTIEPLMTYLSRFDKAGLLEYAVLCTRMFQQRDEQLTYHPAWIKWASEHHDDVV